MLRQILVGALASGCNIAIHAFLMAAVLWAARIAGEIETRRQTTRLVTVMIATVSFLMAAHLAEVPSGRSPTRSSAPPRMATTSFTSPS